MDSSFVTFSPKRKLKKTVHSKITKLSLRHTKRGHDKKSNALHNNKSLRKSDSLQRTPPLTSIINLPADDHHGNFGKKCLDTQNNSSKETKISVEKSSLLNGEDSTSPFDPSSRGSASQFTCSVSVSNKARISEDIITSSKIKIDVRTPSIVSKCNSSIVVISETSSDESSSVAVSKPKKTTTQNVNIVINESDSEPESFYESVNSVDENLSTHKATRTVLHSNASSDKQSEIQKWLQNISPNCKNSHNETRGETVISSPTEVKNPTKSWRSPTRALSSSESEDNFEEFIKSVKKKNQLLQQKVDTPDSLRNFLTDGSVENSPAFYLSLTNKLKTEEKKKAVAERTKKIYEEAKEINPTVLKFNESDAEASDEEIKELKPVQRANASIKVVDTSPDVETSDTASGDTDDDSDSPSIIPPSDNTTERPYQKQPQKVPSCRKPKTVQEKSSTVDQFPVFSFLASLSFDVPQQQSHSDAVLYRREFKKRKEDLCSKLFCLYNKEVFKNQLPSDMSITWNSRLMKTAGLCYNKYSANKRTSRIELSVKVCDSADRLRDTLIHELCHSASWIIDGVKCGHGHHWKIWANTAMKCFPDIPPIRRCHDYKITTKFTYKCVKCGYSIGRHSKSLDIERKRCGYCLGKFELFINKPTSRRRNTKTPAQLQTPRTPSAFAVFVKENYGSVKKERSDLKHGEVMKLLGQKFAAIKVSTCLNTV